VRNTFIFQVASSPTTCGILRTYLAAFRTAGFFQPPSGHWQRNHLSLLFGPKEVKKFNSPLTCLSKSFYLQPIGKFAGIFWCYLPQPASGSHFLLAAGTPTQRYPKDQSRGNQYPSFTVAVG